MRKVVVVILGWEREWVVRATGPGGTSVGTVLFGRYLPNRRTGGHSGGRSSSRRGAQDKKLLGQWVSTCSRGNQRELLYSGTARPGWDTQVGQAGRREGREGEQESDGTAASQGGALTRAREEGERVGWTVAR